MARITKSVEERRQEIIDTAKKLFMANGFEKTQIADISREIGVAQGLVYHYFKSKTELLYAIIDVISEENVETISQVITNNHGSALDCVSLIFTNLMNNENKEKYGILFSSIKADHGLMEYFNKMMSMRTEPLLLSLIEVGNEDGSWKCEYPRDTARFMLQGINGVVELYSQSQDVHQKQQVLNKIVLRTLGEHL
ncbi:TetR/AcrR family transcriptional regulator [Paenibacillus monticola]|uniref:TetR family transcriptional regulator n=1 Tax=Paenibacillus monticola TaxID=2666075 RepID=A0A7X2HA57_9BACL|nr:TetR/AcrR family transcriptional regulator [Paenibacillus monticola]MRN56366.1 TetR family transcriptional regulator [Paenibacillus monticola]